MLRKMLFKNQSKTQFFIALTGALLGFIFLLASVHYLIRVNEFSVGEDILENKGVVIYKKVSTLSSLNVLKTDFNETEIAAIGAEPFVERVSPLLNNSFNISLQTDSDLLPYVRSDIFVQSVDKAFLGVKSLQWDWKLGDEFVPIILPRDFLVMLNSFASAKGIPKISEDIAKKLGFKITLSNSKTKEFFNVRIYGFTNEISSILVPESFIKYGNEKYPTAKPVKTTQLMLNIKAGQFGQFENYLKNHNLETKESSLMLGKLKGIARISFFILMGISALTILLSGLIMTQNAQLLISRNSYEIRTLLRLGYAPKTVIYALLKYFTVTYLAITILSFILFNAIKSSIDNVLIENGIQIATSYTTFSILTLVFALGFYILMTCSSVRKEVKRSQ